MRLFLCACLALLLLFASALAEAPQGDALYVSAAEGDDQNMGTFDSPIRTLEEALVRLRWNPTSERAMVYLRGGEYTLSESIVMTTYERGNVTFASYPGEEAVISGAKQVTGFAETQLNGQIVWSASYETMGNVRALYGEDGARQPSRWPKTGYFRVVREEQAAEDKFARQQRFFINPQDAPALMEGTIVRLLHWWKDELSGVAAYDPTNGLLEMNRPTSMTIQSGDRFFFENMLSAPFSPGEWAFDETERVLYYAPREGETLENTKLYAGYLEQMIYINGVDGITFQNITFTRSAFNIPRGDLASDFGQAAYDANAAIVVIGTSDTQFIGCTFRDMGAGCIQFAGINRGGRVVDSTFADIGAHAVYIHGENTTHEPSISQDFTIENNLIEGYGKNFYGSTAVLVIHARGVRISRNEIHDGDYTAISAGWVWGDEYSVTRDIRVENNLIYNIGQGVLSDMGGIYLLGRQPGTVVSGNIIHNVIANDYGGWGIYLDEGSNGIYVTHNLVYRCSSEGYHQNIGTGNTIINNVFALNGNGQVGLSGKGSFSLMNNVIVGDTPHFRNEGGTIENIDNYMSSDSALFVDAASNNFAILDVGAVSAVGFAPFVYSAGRYIEGY